MVNAKSLRELSSSLNILYAEDEAILRDSMKNILGKLFQNVYVATNGQEALDIYKKESIDIILTDINMPLFSGVELIEKVNQISINPVIIVLSAHDESRLLKKLIDLEVNSFINKPVDKDSLIRVLYKNCSILNDKKLVTEYAQQLEEENESILRKNKILEQKLKQLASQTNKVEEIKKMQNKKEEITNSPDEYFETLLQDDKDELKDLSEELDTYIMMMFQNQTLHKGYINKLSSIYLKYSSILSSYIEFFEPSQSLYKFANTIPTLENKFLLDVNQTGIYLESLQLTLETFRNNIWEKKANNPKFYNASLQNDIQLIIDFLEEKEIQENDIEFF